MLKIYLAGPLFSRAEMNYNESIDKFLVESGFRTFLPQRDGHRLSDLLDDGTSIAEAMTKIFNLDLEEIQNCDVVVINLDGRIPDEGACVEAGYAYAIGKECIGLKTDSRSLMSDLDNPLIVGVLKNRIAHTFEELLDLLLKQQNVFGLGKQS